MKAHDLASWLLKGPNEEVVFEIGHGLYSFEELAEEYGKDAARGLDTEGTLFSDVMDIGAAWNGSRVIKIGDRDYWTEDLGRPAEEFPLLEGLCTQPEWGTSDGCFEGIQDYLLGLEPNS